MTANRRERVPEPQGCDKCTNKVCLAPGPRYGQPCDLVENWLKAQEKGSSIPWDSDTVVLCGDESYMDYLVNNSQPDSIPKSLDFYGIKSLDDFHLTKKQREAVNMFFFESKRISHVAQDLGISSEAVLERLEAAKARMLKQLNRRTLFNVYVKGESVDSIFEGSGIKNSLLAKYITEAYFHEGFPAAQVPVYVDTFHKIKTTLGVVYKYVKIVEAWLSNQELSGQHKIALTNIYY